MPWYVFFKRTPSFTLEWSELAREYAKDLNEALSKARWGIRGQKDEVFVKEIPNTKGFLGSLKAKGQDVNLPSPEMSGVRPFSEQERNEIRELSEIDKEKALGHEKDLNREFFDKDN